MTQPKPQTAAAKTSAAGAKVTVACKLPHGLRLRIFKMVDSNENVAGNTLRTVKRAEQVGEEVVIKGAAVEHGKDKALTDGFALTPGVDKEFWDEWLAQNKDAAYVKSGMIFAAPTRDAVEGEAGERKDQRSGLEPLDMSMVNRGGREVAADPRLPRTNNPNVAPVSTDKDKAAAAA